MSFKQAVANAFHNYATFSGRARRSEYWYFVLFNIIVMFVFSFLETITGGRGVGNLFELLKGLYSLAVIIPGLALCWRRLHDIGRSGGHYFIILIPIVGFILLIYWFCQDSQPGTNMYGANPKGTYYY